MFDKLRMHNYPTYKNTLDKRDWLMPPGGLKKRGAFVIDIGHDTLPPTKHATGGRVPLFAGGAAKKLWQEFIEKLFLKSSNKIRLNKEGLTQGQWIKKHDDLTKKRKEWEMGGKKALPKDMKKFFGMNEIQLVNAFKKAQTQAAGSADELSGIKKVKMTGDENLDYDWVETPEGWVKKSGSEGAFYKFGKENKEFIDRSFLLNREMIRKKYEGVIDEKLLNQILIDDNPQRIAELLATIDEGLIMQQKGMGHEEIIQMFRKTPKTKHATGGRVSLSSGGLAGMLGE